MVRTLWWSMTNSSQDGSTRVQLGAQNCAGIVLAAGSGTRFGGPKAPFEFEGQRLVDRAVSTLTRGGASPIIVVLGAWVGEVPGCEVVINSDFESGMGSSLKVALNHLIDNHPEVDAAIITLVDLIGLTPEAVNHMLLSTGELIQATYNGEIGHPVKINRDHWSALQSELSGDMGARTYLKSNNAITIELSEFGTGVDLDFRPTV
jgi:CTP:molybdopterin cytidylyltransferase MocA